MPPILGISTLQSFIFYPLRCKWNAAFVAFLKSGEINVGFLLYRDSQEILDEAILSNLVQLLPSEFKGTIIIFFLQVMAAGSDFCVRKCYCSEEPF